MMTYLRNRPITMFVLILLVSLGITFAVHLLILSNLNMPLFDGKVTLAYTLNFLLACLTYIFLFKQRKKNTDMLGYYFMGGSFVKFAVYFIFFHPSYKVDGLTSSVEFAAFFTPYGVSLILETLLLIVLLNKTAT